MMSTAVCMVMPITSMNQMLVFRSTTIASNSVINRILALTWVSNLRRKILFGMHRPRVISKIMMNGYTSVFIMVMYWVYIGVYNQFEFSPYVIKLNHTP